MFLQIEIIGGADKYLAVCRCCFQLASKEASPRKSNMAALSPGNAYTNTSVHGNGTKVGNGVNNGKVNLVDSFNAVNVHCS